MTDIPNTIIFLQIIFVDGHSCVISTGHQQIVILSSLQKQRIFEAPVHEPALLASSLSLLHTLEGTRVACEIFSNL